jgi:hypothetical protein
VCVCVSLQRLDQIPFFTKPRMSLMHLDASPTSSPIAARNVAFCPEIRTYGSSCNTQYIVHKTAVTNVATRRKF